MTRAVTRAAMLRRIGDALKGSNPILLPAAAEASRSPGQDAVTAFVNAAAAANAHAEVVNDREALADRLVALCRQLNATSVRLSGRAASMPWRLAEVFAGAGLAVVAPSDRPAIAAGGADVAVTIADYALADTGTIVSMASALEGRLDSVLAPIHVAIVPEAVILPDSWALFAEVSRREIFLEHSSMVLITGPSRTADIELTLTIGVHGPAIVAALVVRDGDWDAPTTAADG